MRNGSSYGSILTQKRVKMGWLKLHSMSRVDSNIIIYAAQAEHAMLRQFIADHSPAVRP
jgi:hypothetical protein